MTARLYTTVYADNDLPTETGHIVSKSLGTVDTWTELEYTVNDHGTGLLRGRINRHLPQAALLVADRYVLVHSDAGVVGGAFLEEAPIDLSSAQGSGDEWMVWGGRSQIVILDRARMDASSNISGGHDPIDGYWDLDNQGPLAGDSNAHPIPMMKRALVELQLNSPSGISVVDHSSWTYDTDTASASVPFLDGEAQGADVGDSGLDLASRFDQLGGVTFEMSPLFKLDAYLTRGTDLSGAFATDTVRFEKGVNIATAIDRKIRGSVNVTHLIVGGADRTFETVVDPDYSSGDVVRWGFLSVPEASDSTQLQSSGLVHIAARKRQTDTWVIPLHDHGDDPANGIYEPAPDGHFWIGDTVSLHTGTGTYDANDEALPVAAITWQLKTGQEANGDYRVIVEVGSTFNWSPSQAQAGSPGSQHRFVLCGPSGSELSLSYASTNSNDLEFGYLGAGGEEVSLWRESVDGGPYPVALPGPTGGEPIWFLRDHTHGCRWTSVDYGPETPSSVFGTHQDHYRRFDNGDGTFSLQWNDGGTSDSGCDTVDGSFVDLRVTYTPGDGDCPEHVGYTCSVGTGTRAARCDHVHAHGLLDEAGTSLHGAHNITYDGSAVGSSADNVQDRLDELASGVSSSISIKHLLTAHPFPICAHRGDIGNDGDSGTSQPENTIEAIRQAVKKGAHLVEFDLYRDSDGVWQLMHDASVTRTTNGTGNVSSKTTAQMAALAIDGGYGYNASRHGTSLAVPTLDSVLDVLRPYDVGVYFHLKETTDAAGTVLAEKIVAEGFVERGIVLCDGGATQAAAVKAVASNLETAVLSGVLTTVESQPDLDRLLARQDHPSSASVVNGHFPKPTDQYFEVTTHYGTDETSAIENAWTYGVRILMTNNLDTALRARERIVERSATLDPSGLVPTNQLGSGSASSSTFLRGDQTWVSAGVTSDAVRDAGRWEVIVSGTAPPVATTNEAEDDWVYGWVTEE